MGTSARRAILVAATVFAASVGTGGGARAATPSCDGKPATVTGVIGTAGNDVIVGTTADEVLVGQGGDDRICGGGGADVIYGDFDERASGAVPPAGTAGNDRLRSTNGNVNDVGDIIVGGAGNDTILGGKGDDTVQAGAGNDVVDERGGNNTHSGGDGNDKLYGNIGIETSDGGPGRDTVLGNGGADLLSGGDGDDLLVGDPSVNDGTNGSDTLDGGAGNDDMWGSNGITRRGNLSGGDSDTCIGGAGTNKPTTAGRQSCEILQ